MRRGSEFEIDSTRPSPVGELPGIGRGDYNVTSDPGRPAIQPSDPIGVDRGDIGHSDYSHSGIPKHNLPLAREIDKRNL